MRWRRRDEGENPAWPGLVDLFAFTLVFVLLLWFGSDLKGEKEKINEKIKKLEEDNSHLKVEKDQLEKEFGKLKDIIGGKGLKELKNIYEIIKVKLPMDYRIVMDEEAIEIQIKGDPPIYFKTGDYQLSKQDQERLRSLAPIILDTVQGKPLYVLINGTADPRFLPDRGFPPHNNVELSALRSATVADTLEKAALGLGKYLRIVGLGVIGEEAPPGVDPEPHYQQYRTINLVIKVDVEKLRFLPALELKQPGH